MTATATSPAAASREPRNSVQLNTATDDAISNAPINRPRVNDSPSHSTALANAKAGIRLMITPAAPASIAVMAQLYKMKLTA